MQLAICGEDALDNLQELQQHYLPNVTFAGANWPSDIPLLNGRYSNEKTLFYICRNKACDAPTDNLDKIKAELRITS